MKCPFVLCESENGYNPETCEILCRDAAAAIVQSHLQCDSRFASCTIDNVAGCEEVDYSYVVETIIENQYQETA